MLTPWECTALKQNPTALQAQPAGPRWEWLVGGMLPAGHPAPLLHTPTCLPLPQPVIFRVEYALEQAGGREFGSVFLSERENVALALVAAGLAKVRSAGGQQSPFYEDLAKAAEDAEARGVGLWTKDHAKLQAAVRASASSEGACRSPSHGLSVRVGDGKKEAACLGEGL